MSDCWLGRRQKALGAPMITCSSPSTLTTVRAFRAPADFVFDGKLNEAHYRETPPITGFSAATVASVIRRPVA